MAIRTVRLDPESERALAEIRHATGMSISGALKRSLAVARDALRGTTARPFEVYRAIDLGPGGYARAPARRAKQALRALLRGKRRA